MILMILMKNELKEWIKDMKSMFLEKTILKI